jgi:hypothetical protein
MNNKIVLMTRGGLLFGQIDSNQKLHHTKITLEEEMPIRIQYMTVSKSLAVGTMSLEKNINSGFVMRKGKIQILDAQTFQGKGYMSLLLLIVYLLFFTST